ncbi:PP2C family protein-serine/threonine phosphatase [Saccharothrix texasensis]|uniref:PP2C family protein-serine/threonine phosphatase n=1 Tax=Saccharothrix texasensis TaxID=103734 RepID=UPI001FEB0C92|nr:hypothetical protein [Saccharothrix texasensis]
MTADADPDLERVVAGLSAVLLNAATITPRSCAGRCATRPGSCGPRRAEGLRAYVEEHKLALVLQRSLLPRELPVVPSPPMAARYQPASAHAEIGGDFYEVTRLGDRLLIAIGDVCLLLVDPADGSTAVANAGHVPPLAAHRAGTDYLPVHGPCSASACRARRRPTWSCSPPTAWWSTRARTSTRTWTCGGAALPVTGRTRVRHDFFPS